MRAEIPFNGPTQEGRLKLVGAQQSINLYPKVQGPGDKNKVSLYSTPGLKFLVSIGSGPCRSNGVVFSNKLYFVSGAELISITEAGSAASAGTLSTTGGQVVLTAGRDYIAIVDGTNGYFCTGTNFGRIDDIDTGTTTSTTANKLVNSGATFVTLGVSVGTRVFNDTDITTALVTAIDSETTLSVDSDIFASGETYTIGDADFPASPTHVTYLDGYFIVNKGASDSFYISSQEDPTQWAALDFAVAQSSPDNILAHTANQKDLYLCGETTTQVYYNSGNADFPFDPYPNGVMQAGIQAKHSLVSTIHGVFWLGRSKEGEIRVVKALGLQPQVVSTPDIDWQISQFTDSTDAVAWIEQDGDRTLYVINFPTADKTYCYDVYLPKEIGWFEKKSFGVGRWRASGYGAIGAKRIIGDYINSNFYTLDFTTFDENGAILERIRRAQIIHEDKKELTINELVLDAQVGVGLTTGQGSDPMIMLRYSHDGAQTWSSELWEQLGKIGERNTEVYWHKLGAERDWIFEVKVTDPVEFNIIGAYVDAEISGW